MNRFLPIYILRALLPITAHAVHAEDLYVTPDGAGASNGTDWANAFAGFTDVAWGLGAGALGAGDTLWVAGGSYANYLELKGSGADGSLLSIKRARGTNSECASAAGWSAAYDSQVVINQYQYGIVQEDDNPTGNGRYILVDGQTNQGFLINLRDNWITNNQSRGVQFMGRAAFHTTIRNVAIYGPHTTGVGSSVPIWTNYVRGLYINSATGNPSHITFDRCTVVGTTDGALLSGCRNITIENSRFDTIGGTALPPGGDQGQVPHPNTFYMTVTGDIIIRWNEFSHQNTEGIFMTSLGGINTNIWIYGNIFRDMTEHLAQAIQVRESATGTGPLYIYNNTFVNVYSAINVNAELSLGVIANNLLVDCAANIGTDYPDNLTTTSNLITTSYAMFVSQGATNVLASPYDWQWVRDLHLVEGSTPINAGANLGAPFNVDMDGNVRGADGTWDIGAYEFAEGEEVEPAAVSGSATAARANVETLILR